MTIVDKMMASRPAIYHTWLLSAAAIAIVCGYGNTTLAAHITRNTRLMVHMRWRRAMMESINRTSPHNTTFIIVCYYVQLPLPLRQLRVNIEHGWLTS